MNDVLRLLAPLSGTTMVAADATGGSETFPSRPLRFIVPFAAGGPGDMLARVLAEKLAQRYGQQVKIDNYHGLNGITGSEIAAKAAPDGYTIVMAASAHYINPSIYKKLPFDPVTDFTPVSLVASGPNIVVLHPAVPAGNIGELIALAKSKPGQLKYGSGGHGSPSHLAGELFKVMAGVDLLHVPYKGHAAAGAALSSHAVDLLFDAVLTAMPHVKKGSWKALAVTTPKRPSSLPDIPTIAESGVPGFEVSPSIGVLAPKGTPQHILDKLSRDIAEIVRMPEVTARLRSDGAEPIGNSSKEYGEYIRKEITKWANVVKDAHVDVRDLPSSE